MSQAPISEGRRSEMVQRLMGMRTELLGYLRVIVRDPHLAEDLLQETFLVFLRRIQDYDPTQDMGKWVRGIGRNLARNALRKSNRLELMPTPELMRRIEEAYETGPDREEETAGRRLDLLHLCLQELKEEHRRMLEMRYYGGASLRKVAEEFGRTEGALQVVLSRIRANLGKCIERKSEEANHVGG